MKREAVVALLNGLNVASAFAAQLLIYHALGISRQTDTYFASVAIPQLLLTVVAGTASGVLVPMLARLPQAQQEQLTGSLITTILGFVALPLALALLTAPVWVGALFPGFTGQAAELAVELVRVQLLATPLMVAGALLTAQHQARGAFATVEAINLGLSMLSLLAMALLLPSFGVLAAAWVLPVRYALQIVSLGRGVRGRDLAPRLGQLLEFWRRSRVLLAGSAYFKADLLVDRYLLSNASAGALSLFSLAQTLLAAIAGVIGQAWGNTAVPRLTAAHAAQDTAAFIALYRARLLRISAIAVMAMGSAMFLVPPLVALVASQRPETDTGASLGLLILALGGVPIFGSLGALVSGCFYAMGDTSTPTLVSIVTFTLFIIGKLIVFDSYGLLAFCILTSVYYAVNALVLGAVLERRLAHRKSS